MPETRIGQLCEEMSVSKKFLADLMLADGGKDSVFVGGGGGGSNNDLTNWDGTKKKRERGRKHDALIPRQLYFNEIVDISG